VKRRGGKKQLRGKGRTRGNDLRSSLSKKKEGKSRNPHTGEGEERTS